MKNEIIKDLDFDNMQNKKSLKLNLTKIENKNVYNNDNSTTTTTTYNNYNQNKGFVRIFFDILILPIKIILELLNKLFKFDNLFKKLKENRQINKKSQRIRKSLKRMNSIYKLEDNEIF